MAQRSARARSKLDKITAANGGPSHPNQNQQKDRRPGPGIGGLGGARLGSGGLLTPSASSISGSSSSRNSLQSSPPQRISKGTLRSFFDAQSEKLRGRLTNGSQRKEGGDAGSTRFYTGLGGGLSGASHGSAGSGGMAGIAAMAEERIDLQRWEGSGSRGELWDGAGSGKKDLELWYPDGDTLVYLTHKPLPSRNPQGLYKPPTPQPSFRLRSAALRNSGSQYLISLLDEYLQQDQPPPKSYNEISEEPHFREQRMDYEYQLHRTKTQDSMTSSRSTTTQTQNASEDGITYRLYFPTPSRLDNIMQHRHHLTTRNFFAVLCNKSLVGITFGQTLIDLLERTEQYLSSASSQYCIGDRPISDIEAFFNSGTNTSQRPTSPTATINSLNLILNYLLTREFDDVRNWPEGAAGLVVFSERAIKLLTTTTNQSPSETSETLTTLWREGFVHCTGMLSSLQLLPCWRDISPITKALIDRASLEIQVRVSNADSQICGFNFGDIWPESLSGSPARIAFDRFQKCLNKHYAEQLGAGNWPPQDGKVSRSLYMLLLRDFEMLYAYLVDRDSVWQGDNIVNRRDKSIHIDDDFLPISAILSSFDSSCNLPPIPHPFPLVPAISTNPKSTKNKTNLFLSRPTTAELALSFLTSSNLSILHDTPHANPLQESFVHHEKSIPATEIHPQAARKGRWVMVYCVLQILRDVVGEEAEEGTKWRGDVEYWVNPRLRGTPPWCGGAGMGRVNGREKVGRDFKRRKDDTESGDEGDDEME
ncbi:hypothetical protein BZA77DRAFT_291978 [Pyronema omphalodes]|nr:hypothetical protein BZA77DRAFT_291978 [Pyronema omphalodes]